MALALLVNTVQRRVYRHGLVIGAILLSPCTWAGLAAAVALCLYWLSWLMTEPSPQHVSMADAVKLLGVCRRTIERMKRDGEIDAHKIRGRRFVPLTEIARLTKPEPVGSPKRRRQRRDQSKS